MDADLFSFLSYDYYIFNNLRCKDKLFPQIKQKNRFKITRNLGKPTLLHLLFKTSTFFPTFAFSFSN